MKFSITCLPYFVISEIQSYLPLDDMLTLLYINREMYNNFLGHLLNHIRIEERKDYLKLRGLIQNKGSRINTLCLKNLTIFQVKYILSKCDRLSTLELKVDTMSSKLFNNLNISFDSLEELILKGTLINIDLNFIYFSHLSRITLDLPMINSKEMVQLLSTIKFKDKIRSISLNLISINKSLVSFCLTQFPSISHFHLKGRIKGNNLNVGLDIFKCNTLKSLKLEFLIDKSDGILRLDSFPNLNSLDLKCNNYNKTSNLKLELLDYHLNLSYLNLINVQIDLNNLFYLKKINTLRIHLSNVDIPFNKIPYLFNKLRSKTSLRWFQYNNSSFYAEDIDPQANIKDKAIQINQNDIFDLLGCLKTG